MIRWKFSLPVRRSYSDHLQDSGYFSSHSFSGGSRFPRILSSEVSFFAYGIQLHDLNPNTILHIACFITLCECFLGIDPYWALWCRIFIIRCPQHYQTGGFNCQVRQDIDYFNLQMPKNNHGWRTKWFYAKDKFLTGQSFGLNEF
jgi:hypothetical protein